MASAAVMAGSVMSTGGIAALAMKVARRKKTGKMDGSNTMTERRMDDGNDEHLSDASSHEHDGE